MERRAGVPKAGLAGAELPEILGRLRHDAAVEPDLNAARRLAADVDVKVDGVGHLGVGGRFGRELLEEVAEVAAELAEDLAAAKPRRRAAHAEREGLSGRQECQEEGTRLRKHVCGTKACSAVLWGVVEWRWTK